MESILLRMPDKAWQKVLLQQLDSGEYTTGDPVIDRLERELLSEVDFDWREGPPSD